ncbi:DUF1878 family protein [Lentibacillus sp. N15]|uniref:DUF1878 family protein n=1 Tax=Lentibacillus songyuanensis TaxID=3136161 RepID=UPI0031BAC4CB
MEKVEKHDTAHFHLQLLSKLIDMRQYPFIKLVIKHNITQEEYRELLGQLHRLNEQYAMQKEEGFLDFSSLLVQFAGMLIEKLDPTKTIFALKKEGYFPSLMDEFIKIMNDQ